MAKSGEAMPDGSYPIADGEDLENAIHAVGRGSGDHDAIRKHIIKRAKALGMSDQIPDNWNADGSITQENSRAGDKQGIGRKKERHRAVPLLPEVRHFRADGLEVRHDSDSDEIVITGSPIIYGVWYRVVDMFGEFEERMHHGVMSDILATVDCRFLYNHDGLVLARTTARTMTLEDSPSELGIVLRLDARQHAANDLAIAIERGDITQMSCGFKVAPGGDEWNGSMTRRDVYRFRDLLDVSAVSYACSDTTHIEVAQRMALAMPVETRARLRQMDVDLRAGKVLSADNQSKLVTALQSLHDLAEAGGVDPADLGPNDDDDAPSTHEDGSEGGDNLESDAGVVYIDGSGARHVAPDTAAERREAMLSFGDTESAVYQALCERFCDDDDDFYYDIWICDLGPDWVVWQCYDEPFGLYRIGYSIDGVNVTLADADPEPVARVTQFVPVATDGGESEMREDQDEAESVSTSMTASTLRLLVEAGRVPAVEEPVRH